MRRSGFSLLEVIIAASVLAIALLGLFSILASSEKATATARERTLAQKAIEQKIERLRALGLADVYSGTRGFAVQGLRVQQGDPDALAGYVWYPGDDPSAVSAAEARRIVAGQATLLPRVLGGGIREDVVFPALGLPCDLNANGQIDVAGYPGPGARRGPAGAPPAPVVLPVVVVVEWVGTTGEGRVAIPTALGPS